MVAPDPESVKLNEKMPRFIYITGCDGTGKTTQAKLLVGQLRQRGVKTRHVWLRYPFFFSIPFLVYARLRGYSWHEEVGGYRHGYWDFRRSWLMRSIFPWLLWVDAALAAVWKIYLPLLAGETIVCERFVLDMLVDLDIAGCVTPTPNHLPWVIYLKLLPGNSFLTILDLDSTTISKRRDDLKSDHLLAEKVEAFRALSKCLKINTISSALPVLDVNRLIFQN